MPESGVLSLGEMALRPEGTPSQRLVRLIISLALRLFFRRIETSGAEQVPRDEPLIFVLNHPNGLIDPALVFCAMPRRISFLAKSTLFEMPIISGLLRLVEALPLYRRADAPSDVSLNLSTFARARELLRRNRCIAIFPEGRSHDSTTLLPIKTGAARIALGALSRRDDSDDRLNLPSLKIVPAGLYYTSKTSFRSEALIRFGAPFGVEAVESDEDGEPPRDAVVELSGRIESALRDVTINVANDTEMETVARAEELFSSIYETLHLRLSLTSEFDLRRRFAETIARGDGPQPPRVERLRARLREFEDDLGGFGIAPENLSVHAHSRWFVARSFLLRWLAVALLSPLAVAGALLHLPAYLVSTYASRRFRRHGVDEIAPTVKILSAIVLMPLTWIVLAAAIYFLFGWRWALASLPLAILCGYVAVRSLETLYDLRGWFRAILLLAHDRRRFLRLLRERAALHREMRALARSGAD
ncbi:MAG: lysophospholipid acyltransferase family protein [Acidobacteria bacterium]|nr:lysophospholipid acyltransferase family protein [Acidobacteriota bacterium]MCA1642270.1 lysophospholipid acyltransferase family protein [Acidobacteriota bacterium]